MGETIESVVAPFKETYALLQKGYREIGIEFAKVYAISFALWIPVVLVMGALMLVSAFFADSYLKGIISIIAIVLMVLVMFIVVVLGTALSGVFYSIVHEKLAGKRISIIGKTKELAAPMARYVVVMALLYGVPLLALLGLVLLAGGSMAGGILMLIGIVAILPLMLLFSFIFQFSILEITLNRKGAVESLKRSLALVKKNLLVTFGFDVAVIMVVFGISAAFSVVTNIVSFFAVGAVFFLPLMILLIIAAVLLIFAQSVVTMMVMAPAQYYFWKSIGGMGAKRV